MKQYLCFKISDYWLGIDVGNVVEIIKPKSNDVLKSDRFDFEGKKLPVVNLADLLLGEQIKSDTDKRVLISEFDGNKAALIVDSAEEILSVENDESNSLEASSIPLNSEYLDGYLALEERNVYLVSPVKLTQLIEVS